MTPQEPLSFLEFAHQLLIALAEEPGSRPDLKQLAEANGLKYKGGWIARSAEYLAGKGWIMVDRAFAHYNSGVDDDYRAAATGVGLAEVDGIARTRPSSKPGAPKLAKGQTAAERQAVYFDEHGLGATAAHFNVKPDTVLRNLRRAAQRGQ
jgi:hypothetical protein